jgi:hypothetical protein
MYTSFLRDLLFVVRFKPHFLETVADGCDNKPDLAGFFGQHFDKVEQLLPAGFAEICLAVLGEMLDIIRQQFAVPVAQMFFAAFHALHVLGAFFFCGLFFAVLVLVPVGKVLAGIEVAVDDTNQGCGMEKAGRCFQPNRPMPKFSRAATSIGSTQEEKNGVTASRSHSPRRQLRRQCETEMGACQLMPCSAVSTIGRACNKKSSPSR